MSLFTSVESEKCLKIDDDSCLDHISSMPDSILNKILSYVPINDVVATSILSKRWNSLSRFEIPPVKLYLINNSESSSASFTSFVDKLLNETLRDASFVKEISIQCSEGFNDEKIISWVNAAVRLNVVKLTLDYAFNNSKALFHSLNGCTTLENLKLEGFFKLKLRKEDPFILPNLKRLVLYNVSFIYEELTEIFFDGFPVLNELVWYYCDMSSLCNLEIHSPLLKVFEVLSDDGGQTTIYINAPNLEVFEYGGDEVTDITVQDCKCLNIVRLNFSCKPKSYELECTPGILPHNYNNRNIGYIVEGISSTINLYLSESTISALHSSLDELPLFMNMTCLALGCIDYNEFQVLGYLLQNAPILEMLIFEEGFGDCEGGYENFESVSPNIHVCVELSLTKTEFRKFGGKEGEIKLIEYFLKNGRVLQEVTIQHLPCVDTGTLNRLNLFPKHSKTCQITFEN